jgi:hypothetical protein
LQESAPERKAGQLGIVGWNPNFKGVKTLQIPHDNKYFRAQQRLYVIFVGCRHRITFMLSEIAKLIQNLFVREEGAGDVGFGGSLAFMALAFALLFVLVIGIQHLMVQQVSDKTIHGLNSIATGTNSQVH